MVFANLTDEDKEAFFALLDEYFASRPELADALKLQLGNDSSVNANSGAAAAHRALANNPQVASAVASAGLRAAVPKSSPFANAASNPQLSNAVGRFAAASLTLNGGNPPRPQVPSPNGTSSDLRPPPPPRRSTSNSSPNTTASEASPQAPPRTTPALLNLVTQRKPGDVDTSGKNMRWGLRNKDAPVPAAPSPLALPSSKAKLAPPPRRGTAPKPRTPTPELKDDEPEYEGEWAEALYEYKSTDQNDLPLKAEQRVLVTARTSDDWWTGEAGGKSGLFPASYVKLL